MCQSGASSVHKALADFKHENLKVFVVWLPRYPGDDRSKAIYATRFVPTSNATHYWHATGVLPKEFGRLLKMPKDQQFAWDTYMVFGPEARWNDSPPEPDDWMHQLGVLGRTHPRWLDTGLFRDSLGSVLGREASSY